MELNKIFIGKSGKQIHGDKARKALKTALEEDILDAYKVKEDTQGEEGIQELERKVVLAVLDKHWRDHLYEMDYLKDGIGLRGIGQRDPLTEYQREGYQMYEDMVDSLKEEVVGLLFKVDEEKVSTSIQTEEVEDSFEDADVEVLEEALNKVSDGEDSNGLRVISKELSVAVDCLDEENKLALPANGGLVKTNSLLGDDLTFVATYKDENYYYHKEDEEKGINKPEPISHADEKVHVKRQVGGTELKSPWADGKTYPGTGRNEQCPCGSGRKYKVCHGRNEK